MALDYRPIKKTKTSDLIVEEIWQLILAGDLKPGDKLPPERELVSKFGVSKVTLREALQTLEAYGHITRKRGAHGGTIVLDIAPANRLRPILDYLKLAGCTLEDLISARLTFEPVIAGLAAKRITPEGIRELREMLEQHENDFRIRGTSHYGWEFYLLLARQTGNPIFQIIEELLIRLLIDTEFALAIGDLNSKDKQRLYDKQSLADHKKAAAAVIGRNPVAARKAMIEHKQKWARLIREIDREKNKKRKKRAS